MAQRLGGQYWLYVVENTADKSRLHTLQNPAARLKAEEVVGVVGYIMRD
ncbi:MAG: hypothetical protein ACUVRY_08100 [Thermoanaerobaculaceae bacterium]